MIAGVKICGGADILSLRIIALRYCVCRIAEFTFFIAEPDDLARRVDGSPGFFHNLRDAAETIISKLAAGGESGVVNRDEPIRAVPFEGPAPAVAGDAAVEII